MFKKIEQIIGVREESRKEDLANEIKRLSYELARIEAIEKTQMAKDGLNYAGEKITEGAEYAGEQIKDGAAALYEASKEPAANAYEWAKESAQAAANAASEKASELYEAAKIHGTEYASEGADQIKAGAEAAAKYTSEKGAEGWEASKGYLAEGAEKASDLASDAFTSAKDYVTGIEFSEIIDSLGNKISQYTDQTGNVWERVTDKSGDYYERVVKAANEYTDEAGNVYSDTKDAAGKESRKLLRKADKESQGILNSLRSLYGSGKQDTKEAIGSTEKWASEQAQKGKDYAEQAGQQAKAGYEYVKNAAGDFVLQAKKTAENTKWKETYLSHSWQHFFKKHTELDQEWWKNYLSKSSVDPNNWKKYIQSYNQGPKSLEKYWRSVQKSGYDSKVYVQDAYKNAKEQGQEYLDDATSQFSSTPDVAVSLFWTAILAVYMLIVARRLYAQRLSNSAGRASPSGEKGQIISHLPSAASDALNTFSIYAPTTITVLLGCEISGVLSKAYLHTFYASLFAGQFLQNETGAVKDVRARGLGVYLSLLSVGGAAALAATSAMQSGSLW